MSSLINIVGDNSIEDGQNSVRSVLSIKRSNHKYEPSNGHGLSIDLIMKNGSKVEKTCGAIVSTLNDVNNGDETADISLKLIHDNILSERFIFSPGSTNDDNDNKLKLINTVANSNGANSRASKVVFSGIQDEESGTVSDLAYIEGSHYSTGTDNKGQLKFYINDGDDTTSLHNIMTLNHATSVANGTATAGGNNTITLAEGSSSANDYYNNYIIKITGGTGAAQVKRITDYNGATRVVTVDSAWTTNPDNTSTYQINSATVTINGDLAVNSASLSFNTTKKDKLIKLGQDSIVTNEDLGIIFTRGNGTSTNIANKGFIWDESQETFALIGCNTEDGTTSGNIDIDGYESLVCGAITSMGNLAITGTITGDTSLTLDTTTVTTAEIGVLASVTAGTASTSKAVVLDESKNIASIGTVGCGAITSTGNSSMVQLTTSGRVIVDDATEATTTTDGSLQTDGGLSVAKDIIAGNDLKLLSDSSVISLGAGSNATLTHDGTTGLTIAANPISINSTNDLTLDSNTNIILDADGGNISFKDNGSVLFGFQSNYINFSSTNGDTGFGFKNNSGTLQFKNSGGSWTDIVSGLNDLSDVLIEDNSLYIGKDPSSTTSTAQYNVGVGATALEAITSGDNNTCVGYNAGNSITTGEQNTCIGSGASTSAATGVNQMAIGYGAVCNANNQITLGNHSVSTLRCGTTAIATLSDKRDKKDIEDCAYGEEFINKVKPRKFTWDKRVLNKGDENFSKNGKQELGFIAQEMEEAMEGENKELLDLVLDSNPERLEIKAANLLPIMVKALQEMSSKIKSLETELKNLKQ